MTLEFNYHDIFNLEYSKMPVGIKAEIMEAYLTMVNEDIIAEAFDSENDFIKPMVDYLELLVNSNLTEEDLNSIIDITFGSLSESALDNIYEGFIKREAISILEEYINEVSLNFVQQKAQNAIKQREKEAKKLSHPIGLAGVRRAAHAQERVQQAKGTVERINKLKSAAQQVAGARRVEAKARDIAASSATSKRNPARHHADEVAGAEANIRAEHAEKTASGEARYKAKHRPVSVNNEQKMIKVKRKAKNQEEEIEANNNNSETTTTEKGSTPTETTTQSVDKKDLTPDEISKKGYIYIQGIANNKNGKWSDSAVAAAKAELNKRNAQNNETNKNKPATRGTSRNNNTSTTNGTSKLADTMRAYNQSAAKNNGAGEGDVTNELEKKVAQAEEEAKNEDGTVSNEPKNQPAGNQNKKGEQQPSTGKVTKLSPKNKTQSKSKSSDELKKVSEDPDVPVDVQAKAAVRAQKQGQDKNNLTVKSIGAIKNKNTLKKIMNNETYPEEVREEAKKKFNEMGGEIVKTPKRIIVKKNKKVEKTAETTPAETTTTPVEKAESGNNSDETPEEKRERLKADREYKKSLENQKKMEELKAQRQRDNEAIEKRNQARAEGRNDESDSTSSDSTSYNEDVVNQATERAGNETRRILNNKMKAAEAKLKGAEEGSQEYKDAQEEIKNIKKQISLYTNTPVVKSNESLSEAIGLLVSSTISNKELVNLMEMLIDSKSITLNKIKQWAKDRYNK